MSRLQALSADLDFPEESVLPVRGLWAADGLDAPLGSPVHELHVQLQQLEEPVDHRDIQSDKAPGWVRLTLPVIVSMALWTVILRITGLIG